MQNAAYGIFKNGQVILDESVTVPNDSNVIVVFLDKQKDTPTQDKNTLLNIFSTLGAWEDSKDTETIISEIENSRMSRTADIDI
jgi:hypothetical protein